MADHSQKWHDGTTSRNIRSSSSKDGLAALVNKLDNLGRDMKKLKESITTLLNNPTHRSFDDYKWEFNLEIDKLADEYELGIGKKGHILDNIWEYCNQVHYKNNEWHDYEFKNEECENRNRDKDINPPEV
ncbi:hypothetical protein Tco_0968012 [Tanacetum coccineum]